MTNSAAPSCDIHRTPSAAGVLRARRLLYCINISLAVGIVLFAVKMYAYYFTASVAVLSDVAESVAHFFVMCFTAYSVRFSQKPPDRNHLYGHDRISFFAVGFEGAMIAVAGVFIVYEAAQRWYSGDSYLHTDKVGGGIALIALATVVNGALGVFLLRRGKQLNSLVLTANGRHVLADGITSAGVILGLILVQTTGWISWDFICAFVIAMHIIWSGADILRKSVGGLMDAADPQTDAILREVLDEETRKYGVHYHLLRHRDSGGRIVIDFHLLFDKDTTIARAHDIAIFIEHAIDTRFDTPTEVTSHFEPMQGHDEAHKISK